MTEQGHNELTQALSGIAVELHKVCLRNTGGVNQVPCDPNAQRQWLGPPMRTNTSFAGIKLSDLAKHIYLEGSLTTSQSRQEIWDECVTDMLEGRSVSRIAHVNFPAVAFARAPTAALAQLLWCLWGSGGRLDITQSHAFLQMPVRIGFDDRVVVYKNTQVRLPKAARVNPAAVLAAPNGRRKVALAETTAVFRHLVLVMPEFASELDVIFATAIAAGREFEDILRNPFFLVPVDDDDLSTKTVWDTARNIVTKTTKHPNEELWALLRGKVSYAVFTKAFGAPVSRATPYSPTLRSRHLVAINKFESGEVSAAVKKSAGDPVAAANSLLQLQSLMGSWK